MTATVPQAPLPWWAKAILVHPRHIEHNLENIAAARIVELVPNSWQIFLGVMRMWHRILFRNDSIGTCSTDPVRNTRRARILNWRAPRLPLLLWEGSVVPLDLSGLASSSETLMTHLLGTHHDGDAFFYDLRILSCHPGLLEDLRRRTVEVIENDTPRSRWLRDLCVYENYHEHLLAAVDRALAGSWTVKPGPPDADTSLEAYLDWCARQPATPAATLEAWRNGTLDITTPSVVAEATTQRSES